MLTEAEIDSMQTVISYFFLVCLSITSKIIALAFFPAIIIYAVYRVYRLFKPKKPSGLEIINRINDAPVPDGWKFDGYRDENDVAFDPHLHPDRKVITALFCVEKCHIAALKQKKVCDTDTHISITNFKLSKNDSAQFLDTQEGGLSCHLHVPAGGYFRQMHIHESTSHDLIQKIKDLYDSRTPAKIEGHVLWTDFQDKKLQGRGNFYGFNDMKNSCPVIFLKHVEAAK